MKRKFFSGVLCALGVMTGCVIYSNAADIQDINGHWAYESMMNAVNDGYLYGDENGMLYPDASLTGGEMVAILNRVLQPDNLDRTYNCADWQWYAKDANYAVSAGYLPIDGHMNLDLPVTRAEMMIALTEAFGLSKAQPDISVLDMYPDSSNMTATQKRAASVLIEHGLVFGDTIGGLRAANDVSRAEFISMIYRITDDKFMTVYNSEDENKQNQAVGTTSIPENKNTAVYMLVDENNLSKLDSSIDYNTVVFKGEMPDCDKKISADRIVFATTGENVELNEDFNSECGVVVVAGGTGDVVISSETVKKLEITGFDRTINLIGLELDSLTISGDQNRVIIGEDTSINELNIVEGAVKNDITLNGYIENAKVAGEQNSVLGEGICQNAVVPGIGCNVNANSLEVTGIDNGLNGVNITLTKPELLWNGVLKTNAVITGVKNNITVSAEWYCNGVADANYSNDALRLEDGKNSTYEYQMIFPCDDIKSYELKLVLNYVNMTSGAMETVSGSTTFEIDSYTNLIKNGVWVAPLGDIPWRTEITSEFGYRIHPVTGIINSFHNGVDIGVPMGTPITAIKSGIITTADWDGLSGLCVRINHGGGVESAYAHCSEIWVTSGQYVEAGQVIALVGNTGRSTGPHLHLGIKVNGEYINPCHYIP